VLATDIRNASGDIDAVFAQHAEATRELAKHVARELRLPSDWINQAVKQFAPPRGNPAPNLIPFSDYPRGVGLQKGLRVSLPTPEYLLAMKLLSNRAVEEVDKIASDSVDTLGLMAITGIDTYDKIVELMRACYPNIPGVVSPDVSPRMKSKIETVLRRYNEIDPNDPPTWHAGRGDTLA
jgi:hypothetical protein